MSQDPQSGTGIASPKGLFGGRLVYKQPEKGFRSSVDSLALSFYIWTRTTHAPQRLCDLGCGAGFLALTAALMWPRTKICGIEISPERASYAQSNASANQMQDQVAIVEGDIKDLTFDAPFDIVVSNPPYHPITSGTLPKDPDNARARFEVSLDLAALLNIGKTLLNENGRFFLVYPIKRWMDLVNTANTAGLRVVHYRRVRPTPKADALLVVVELQHHTQNPAEHAPEQGPELVLENSEMNLGEELAKFASMMAQNNPQASRGPKNSES